MSNEQLSQNDSKDFKIRQIQLNENKNDDDQGINRDARNPGRRQADPTDFIIKAHSSTYILDGDISARSIDENFF